MDIKNLMRDYSFPNWHMDNAKPIKESTIEIAENLLTQFPKGFKTPDIAPGIDGSVCMEWIFKNSEIFVDVDSDDSVLAFAIINGEKISGISSILEKLKL